MWYQLHSYLHCVWMLIDKELEDQGTLEDQERTVQCSGDIYGQSTFSSRIPLLHAVWWYIYYNKLANEAVPPFGTYFAA